MANLFKLHSANEISGQLASPRICLLRADLVAAYEQGAYMGAKNAFSDILAVIKAGWTIEMIEDEIRRLKAEET